MKKIIVICFYLFNCNFISTLNADPLEKKTVKLFKNKIVSIRTTKAYLRYGPGKHFPIKWVFTKKKIPVLIIDKYDTWKKIKLRDKTYGWIHNSQLSAKKTSIVIFSDYLRKSPNKKGKKLAFLKKELLVEIIKCKVSWCKINLQKNNLNGWFIKNYLWGANYIEPN